MKILYVTTVGITMGFFKSFVKELIDLGHTVDIACNDTDKKIPQCYFDWGCKHYPLSCSRSPLNAGNIKAVLEIKDIVKTNGYDVVHCHTPIAAACTRLACKPLRKKGVRVLYTAHGFHFYKGAPLVNWLIYYPLEKLCAPFTDVLITINAEDYNLAKSKMRAKAVEFVAGVGIDYKKISATTVDREQKRAELGIPKNAVLLASVGELNHNKNHKIIIEAMAKLNNPNLHYVIAGMGELHEYLKGLANQLGLLKNVHLLGYRNDVASIYAASDVCCFPSIREGLPVALTEGMATGLAAVAAINRGTCELVQNGKNGYLIDYNDVDGFANAIKTLCENHELTKQLGDVAKQSVERFDIGAVNKKMKQIYNVSEE